jgi:hypothetical protein
MLFKRVFAMPSRGTFSVPPIGDNCAFWGFAMTEPTDDAMLARLRECVAGFKTAERNLRAEAAVIRDDGSGLKRLWHARAELFERYADELDALADALARSASERGREWQPIETAPRDGTFVDLWFPHNGETLQSRRVADCRWLKIKAFEADSLYAWFAQSGGRAFRMDGPTHWMPLPEPPHE